MVRSAELPRAFYDVTVRHSVPGGADRLAAAAQHPGAVNREAEGDKARRYPDHRSPWRVVPLAAETCGRLGPAALRHLRSLARTQAARLPEDDGEAASALVLSWGYRLSVALQRANAELLRTSLGAPRGTSAHLAAGLAA